MTMNNIGRLIYVMGASGVGKDSLLRELHQHRPDALVAHRYITRASGRAENCIELDPTAFAWRRKRGLFCLDWTAHGLHYGVGIELEQWLAADHTVVLNGSRRALDCARRRFGKMLMPVLIVADVEVLRQRLIARGRETPEQIESRLAQHDSIAVPSGTVTIDNSSDLITGARSLERYLDQSTPEETS